MVVLLGDVFPNFEADSSVGKIKFHEWLGDSWGVLFSHPADFTPVCTTELARAASLHGEFEQRGVKMLGLSIDSAESHREWAKDIVAFMGSAAGTPLPFPIVADENRRLAVELGMLDPNEVDGRGMPLTARCVFVIGPDKRMKLSILYPASTGRNFDEILRAIDSLQVTAATQSATPVDWKKGERVIVPPNVPDCDLPRLFPHGVETTQLPSGRPYLRYARTAP
ncbi:peroxiredoxin-6 [Lampetra fluviatilis]